MAKVTPIPISWINKKAKKTLIKMYGKQRLMIQALPNIVSPDDFPHQACFDVEFMIALLSHGAWITKDWKPYARYTIAQRLKTNKEAIFVEPFDKIADDFLNFQLYGGTFQAAAALRKQAVATMKSGGRTARQMAAAKLILSTMDEIQFNTLVQPFHWIRLAKAVEEQCPVYSLAAYAIEKHKQKLTLVRLLQS